MAETAIVCTTCRDSGTVYVRNGHEWEPLECPDCPQTSLIATAGVEADRG